jgi:hypothetical protein
MITNILQEFGMTTTKSTVGSMGNGALENLGLIMKYTQATYRYTKQN